MSLSGSSLVDFSNCPQTLADIDGAAEKYEVLYEGDAWILKFGSSLFPSENNRLQDSYANTPVSEHLGCKVFSALGIETQETVLGTCHLRDVVAMRDFIAPLGAGYRLITYKELETNVLVDALRKRYPVLDNIPFVLKMHPFLEEFAERAWDRYWKTFVVDSIIGNFDRHGGNFGFIAKDVKEADSKIVGLAPVYDCGSSFAPMLSEEAMASLVMNEQKLKSRALAFPNAALFVGNGRVSYHGLLLDEKRGKPARDALVELAPAIGDLDVASLASTIPDISDVRIAYYDAHARSRIEAILQPAYELACRERGLEPGRLAPEFTVSRYFASTLGREMRDAADRGLSRSDGILVRESICER